MQQVVLCLNWCASTGNPSLPPQLDEPKGQVEYWNAGCGESRTSGVDAGKGVSPTYAYVSAQIWYLMYNDRTGIISYLLQQMHLLAPGATVLQTNSGIITAAIIADVWKTTPFIALLLLAGLQVIPTEMYEAADVDGATRFQQFWTITLPMLNGQLTIALLFRTLASLGVFDLFYILGGNQVQS